MPLTLLSNNLLVAKLGPPVWHWLEAAGAYEMAALRGAAVLLRSCRQEKSVGQEPRCKDVLANQEKCCCCAKVGFNVHCLTTQSFLFNAFGVRVPTTKTPIYATIYRKTGTVVTRRHL